MYGLEQICLPCGQAIDVPDFDAYLSFGVVENTELKIVKVVTRPVCE